MERNEGGIGSALKTKLALVANIAVLGFVAWGFSKEYLHNRELESQVAALVRKGEELERDSVQLAESQRRQDGGSQIERDARLRLGLQKPGEQVVVVRGAIPRSETQRVMADDAGAASDAFANAARWWRRFFHGSR